MNKLIIITGPSCAGKSTLESLLVKKGMNRVKSTTTRAIRAGERQGREYNFVPRIDFDFAEKLGEFVEAVEFNGSRYGVTKEDIKSALRHNNAVIVVEPHGKQQIEKFAEKNDIEVFRIFVSNPMEVIFARFLQRFADDYIAKGSHTVETYATRLKTMQSVEVSWHLDANSNNYDLVINQFDETTVVPVLQKIMKLLESPQIAQAA